jgi:hypothetical protein
MTYDGIARGNFIEFSQPLPFNDQPVRVSIEVLPAEVGSSTAVLQAARRPPQLRPQDVDDLEREITESTLAVQTEEFFDASGNS